MSTAAEAHRPSHDCCRLQGEGHLEDPSCGVMTCNTDSMGAQIVFLRHRSAS